MTASADEIVVLLQAITELLNAYDMIEQECHDVEHHTISLLLTQLMRQDRHRVQLYVERVEPAYADLEFRKMFQLSRSAAAALAEEFEKSAFYQQSSCRMNEASSQLRNAC